MRHQRFASSSPATEDIMTTAPRLWKSQTIVNTSDAPVAPGRTAAQLDGHLIGLQDGGYVVVWSDNSGTYNPNGFAIVAQRYDIFGNKVGGEVPVSYLTSGDQIAPAITRLDNGNIAIAFEDQTGGDRDIYVRILDSALNVLRTDTIDTGTNLTFDASIAALAGGGYAVSYTVGSGDDTDIVARIVSPTGVAGDQFDIDNQTDNRNFSQLATLSNGNVVVAYQDDFNNVPLNTDVKYAIFTPAGALVTGPTTVPGGGDSVAERDADVAALRNGGFVVVWTDLATSSHDIRASILSNTGATVTSNIPVHANQGSEEEPRVVALADGGFLVSWNDVTTGTDFVRAQRFDALGNKIGAEFTVKEGIDPVGAPPDAALLADGRIAFALGDGSIPDANVMTSIWDPRTLEGNFDGVNQSDLLWLHDSGQAAVWLLQDTTAVLGLPVGPSVGTTWHLRGTADLDADGHSDFLWQNDNGQAAAWLTSPPFAAAIGANPGASWQVIDSGDFNADNHDDLLWQDAGGQASLWLLNGAAVISAAAIGSNMGPTWHVKAAGDFTGDHHTDILWQHDSGQAALWLIGGDDPASGPGVIGGEVVGPNMGPTWHVIDAGDFNGDGRSDILWQNDNGQAAIWLMSGTNLIGGAMVGPNLGPSWHVIGAGQFNNGDTKSDILWQHDSGQASVWLMDGTTLVSGVAVGPNPGADWHLIV
jgi:VCBS repeat protein